MITQEELKKKLRYDPETGYFHWIDHPRNGNKVAGAINKFDGYLQLRLGQQLYRLHRLAWLYMTGEWPNHIDHINRDRADNRWSNLRNASKKQNQWNQPVRIDNTSGYTGVRQEGRKWAATIVHNGRGIRLGLYSNFDAALSARRNAEMKLRGEFAPGGA